MIRLQPRTTMDHRPLLGFLFASLLLILPGLGQSAPAEPVSVAEVGFEQAKPFAIITEFPSGRQRLVGVGDGLGESTGAGPQWRAQQIERDRLQLLDLRTQKSVWLPVGKAVPGLVGQRLTRILELAGIEYRYVMRPGRLDSEPRLLAIRDARGVLEVDVAPSAPVASRALPEAPAAGAAIAPLPTGDRKLDATLLGRVRVTPTARDTYEVRAADLQQALEHGGQVLAEAWPKIWPTVSLQQGIGFKVQSPVADGVLGPRGFQVISPNLAERAGIQVGDVVLTVNGQPVNGPGDVFQLYQQVRRDPRLNVVTVTLERQGQPVIKTYRIR
jgi:hypothetical protein